MLRYEAYPSPLGEISLRFVGKTDVLPFATNHIDFSCHFSGTDLKIKTTGAKHSMYRISK